MGIQGFQFAGKFTEVLFVNVGYDALVAKKVKLKGLLFLVLSKFKSRVSFRDDVNVSIKLSVPFLFKFLFGDEAFEVDSCSFIV